ncbi:hypothetical protein Cgig2_030428 [Carnegiea gigantea]|uniref:Uncharacterized protein n=1 Tax=Carnegiea gigantea TaxID=171969 RepID=A0A9Q1KR60_9CARY|nr:hypothetical protein Cgig2_030428 [Carnegiea gigantea]
MDDDDIVVEIHHAGIFVDGIELEYVRGRVSEMELRIGRKRMYSAGFPETSGRTGEESDPKYRSGDEGGSQHNGSESAAREDVSNSSSSDHFKGEMRLKKRHDQRRERQRVVGHTKGFGVKGKGKGKAEDVKRRSTYDEREDAGRQQAVDVDIRCALDAICALNDQLSDIQKEAVRGMVWFYEHFSIYAFADERRVPRLSSWVNLYEGKKYDTAVVVRKLKDSEGVISVEERLRRARDALRKEIEALAKEKQHML